MFMIHKECNIKESTRYHRIKTDCSHSLTAYYTEELSAKRRIWDGQSNTLLGMTMKDYKLGELR